MKSSCSLTLKLFMASSLLSLSIASAHQPDWVEKGRSAYRSGQLEAALNYTTQAIGSNENDAEAYRWRANIEDSLNQDSQAIADYKKSIDLDRMNPKVYYDLGLFYDKRNDFKLTYLNYKKAVELDHNYAAALAKLAYVYSLRGEENPFFDPYLAYLLREKALSSGQPDSDLLEVIYEVDMGLHHYADATWSMTKALQQKNDSRYYYFRAQAYCTAGNGEKCLADYDNFITYNPKSAQAFMERGALKLALGMRENGLDDQVHGISLDHRAVDMLESKYQTWTLFGGDKQYTDEERDELIAQLQYLQKYIKEPFVYTEQAVLDTQKKSYQEAINVYNAYFAAFPPKVLNEQPNVYYKVGYLYYQLHNVAAARQSYLKGLKAAKSSEDGETFYYNIRQIPETFNNSDSYRFIATVMDDIIRLYPSEHSAYLLHAEMDEHQKKFLDAQKNLAKAIGYGEKSSEVSVLRTKINKALYPARKAVKGVSK
jgi:tetratricopeptide (TPR) repeat protein